MTGSEIADQFDEIRGVLAETARIQREQASVLLNHPKVMAGYDERMDRIGRHLLRLRCHKITR